jgi:FkbM family methyltransferase
MRAANWPIPFNAIYRVSATIRLMKVREQVRRATRRLLARQGFELSRMNGQDNSLDALLIRLLREKHVTAVLDVGANRGHFVDYLRRQGYDGRVISFEPLSPEPFATLARRVEGNPQWDAVQVAISDAPGTATIHRSGNTDGLSSLLTQTDAMVKFMPGAAPTEELEVRVSTVDEQVRHRLMDVDRPFLKIDTQGNELSVLWGAEATLRRAAGVLVELSFVELYKGQALFGEIVDWLAARNFFLLAMAPVYRDHRTGQLLQVDALFGVLSIPQ